MNTRIVAAGLLIAVTAIASAEGLREGKWEYTVTMDMAGMPAMPQLPPGTQLPPGVKLPTMGPNGMTSTFQNCVTEDKPVPHNDKGGEHCTTTKMERHGATINYAMHCTDKSGGALDGEGSATYNGETMTSNMKMKGTSHGHPVDMTQTTTGRYLGPCT
jgi:hypothetical protein